MKEESPPRTASKKRNWAADSLKAGGVVVGLGGLLVLVARCSGPASDLREVHRQSIGLASTPETYLPRDYTMPGMGVVVRGAADMLREKLPPPLSKTHSVTDKNEELQERLKRQQAAVYKLLNEPEFMLSDFADVEDIAVFTSRKNGQGEPVAIFPALFNGWIPQSKESLDAPHIVAIESGIYDPANPFEGQGGTMLAAFRCEKKEGGGYDFLFKGALRDQTLIPELNAKDIYSRSLAALEEKLASMPPEKAPDPAIDPGQKDLTPRQLVQLAFKEERAILEALKKHLAKTLEKLNTTTLDRGAPEANPGTVTPSR